MATEDVLDREAIALEEPAAEPATEQRLGQNRNFRWICAGVSIATLGSQFSALALPWLVLKMTGDTLALATVMAISGVPQIFLLLFGGSLADRFSPKRILVWAYLTCALLLIALGGLLFSGLLKLWMIDAFAFSTGLVFGMSIPASFSLIAAALPGHMVPAGSSVIGSIRQALAFVGPLLAGALLGFSGDGQAAGHEVLGSQPLFAAAFFLDGLGLLFVAWTTANIVFRTSSEAPGEGVRNGFNILPALRWFLADRQVLTVVCYWSLIVFFLSGPVRIALPLLAEQNTALGAKAYGILVSANAAGVFLGMTALGLLRRFVADRLWPVILCLDALAALIVVGIGLLHPQLQLAVFVYAALFVLVGTRAGFVEIGWFSWLQQRFPDEIRGRATSIFMVVSTANIAASVTFSGWLTRHVQASELFLLAGAATVSLALLGMLLRALGVLRVDA
ncbi:MFS transporter [Dyella tabacisoli]|uniref:MFS transporter n=1 Tax=Dyella tabacisoli TaxID=2282381 RepID=UPI0013B454D4|nr:MFS transporter [Dyella tabacisoli]